MPTWDVLWTTGKTVYFVAFTGTNSYWRNDSSVAEAYQAGHLPLYSVPAAESQRKGVYTATVPPALPQGDWVVLAFDNAGAVPQSSESEVDAPAGSGRYFGSGVAEIVASSGTGAYPMLVHVTDGTSPILGATVRASGAQTAVGTTDSSGNVTLSLNAGNVTITASATGYAGAAGGQAVDGTGKWVSSGASSLIVVLMGIGGVATVTAA